MPYLFPKRQILYLSILKECAEDNFKLDKIGRKLSKWVEKTVGKGEIACYEQFLLFPVFKRLVSQGRRKVSLCGNGLTISQTTKFIPFQIERVCRQQFIIYNLVKTYGKFFKGIENTVGKGEIARYEQFLLFPQCFKKTCTADS